MVSIGKINIGRKEKRAFFPLNHDVNTTSDFGFCQPTLVRHFIKGSKISLKSKTGVRLSALPCPTFGRIECKQHTAFVPVTDVFEAFEYQQANKSVSSALRSYIPATTDNVKNVDIYKYMFDIAFASEYEFNSSLSSFLSLIPFRLSLWLNSSGFDKGTGTADRQWTDLVNLVGRNTYFDIFNDERIYGANSTVTDNFRKFCYEIGLTILSKLPSYLENDFFYEKVGNITLNGVRTNNNVIPPSLFSYLLSKDYGQSGGSTTSNLRYGRWVYSNNIVIPNTPYNISDSVKFNFSRSINSHLFGVYLGDSRNAYIYNPLTVANADFLHKTTTLEEVQFSNVTGDTSFDNISYDSGINVGVHFTPNGKRLMKILTACRINFGRSHLVSLNSLLAYYKVWFDKYNAGRNIQWRDTNAYKLIHTYYDTGIPSCVVYAQDESSPTYDFLSAKIIQNLRYNMLHFLLDMYNCTFCDKLDNITVATDSPILENTINNNSNYVDISSGSEIQPYSEGAGQTFNIPTTKISNMNLSQDDSQPYYRSYDSTGLSVRFMQTIYKLVNKNSVLGSKVDDYLRAHGIANGLPKTKVLGDSSFMCNIDDVYGTVNNDSTALGEYAGRGLGSSEGENKSAPTMKFECDEFGYLIQLTTIVPIGGYVQGDTQDPISRYDFYQSEFDGLGMEVLPQSAVIGRQSCFYEQVPDRVFGFVPRYMSLKVQNNLANGGFAFNSESAQFLPYSLDKLFSTGSPTEYENLYGDSVENYFNKDLVCDEELRYIGRYEKYGNFDRIFYDTLGITDNFVVHIVQELSMYAPMRPIDNSFETYDEFNDDSSVALEHA